MSSTRALRQTGLKRNQNARPGRTSGGRSVFASSCESGIQIRHGGRVTRRRRCRSRGIFVTLLGECQPPRRPPNAEETPRRKQGFVARADQEARPRDSHVRQQRLQAHRRDKTSANDIAAHMDAV